MAEMDTSSGGGHKKGPGVKKGKKLSTRVDLTPMVDLGFLLITFFIFTTTMSQPTAMKLFLPKDTEKPEEQNKVKQSGALTIMLSKNDAIFYYEGELKTDGSNFKSATFKEIRDIIINKRQDVMNTHVHDSGCQEIWAKNNGNEKSCLDKDLVVVIKPTAEATFRNVIDILDEMSINEVKRYAMVDISEPELMLVKATEAASGVK
ncbi:MAG: ExbD/TolR family protein [Chitinophagaceae bacterium]